jgi:hypothetical protein
MAWELDNDAITRTAASDLSTTGIYRFIKQSNAGAVSICSVASENALGVLQNNPESGYPATVCYNGVTKIYLGGTVAIGDLVSTDTAGRAVTASGGVILGECLQGGSVGAIGTIIFNPRVASGSVLVTSATTLQSATVTVTTGELLALNATPKTLVAAPGTGYAIALDSAVVFLDYNSAAYDGIAAGEDLTIRYTNGSGALLATVETTGFLDATADAVRFVQPTTTAAITPADNAALVLHLSTGEIATGNSPLKVKVNYYLSPTSL